jgi:hypothetical protein
MSVSLGAPTQSRYRLIIRQWQMLRVLAAHARGVTLANLVELAGDGACQRTVRRDLEALEYAGFPVERIDRSPIEVRWRLNLKDWRGELLRRSLPEGGTR